jgi:hypothetical protein
MSKIKNNHNRRKMIKIIILTFVSLACFFIAGLFLLPDDMCATSILKNIPSPNKQLQAVIFQVDCGATTDFNRHVAIIPFNNSLTPDNSSFFAMDNKKGSLDINILWHSNAALEIQYHELARIFHAEKNADGVNIVYRTYHK